MTVCAAWRSHGVVFFLADSVITTKGTGRLKPAFEVSSFNERHIHDEHETVQDVALKLYPISKHLMATGTGSSSDILRFVESVRFLIRDKFSLHIAADTALQNGTFSEDFRVFIGGIEDGQDVLFDVSSHNKTVRPVGSVTDNIVSWSGYIAEMEQFFLVGGSVDDERKQQLRFDCAQAILDVDYDFDSAIDVILSGREDDFERDFRANAVMHVRDPEGALVSAAAFLQAQTVHEPLLQGQHAGGAILAAYVDAKGTHWQPDIRYVLIDRIQQPVFVDRAYEIPAKESLTQPQYITTLVRDGLAIVASSVQGVATVRTVYGESPQLSRIQRKGLNRQLKKARPRFWVLINTSSNNTVVIDRRGEPDRFVAEKGSIVWIHRVVLDHVYRRPHPRLRGHGMYLRARAFGDRIPNPVDP